MILIISEPDYELLRERRIRYMYLNLVKLPFTSTFLSYMRNLKF